MSDHKVERRLSAVMVADVAGYSRHMGADEAGTRSRFNSLLERVIQPTVARHGGRIVKTSGDGLLLEFPSIVSSVQCALDWQSGIDAAQDATPPAERLAFRIGINLGDVIVEGDDIHGDGVNTAARLEALADPGGIALSLSARDQVRDKLAIDLIDMGEVEVKNILRPIRLFMVGAEGVARRPPVSPRRRWRMPALALALLAGLGVLGWVWIGPGDGPDSAALAVPDKPSLVVLPFRSAPDDAARWTAESIVQDITSNLSQVSGLFVISAGSAFAYRDGTATPQQIAAELGVRNVVQGTIRSQGETLMASVEMIDGRSGATIWQQDFEQTSGNSFALREDIARSVARELAVNVSRSSAASRPTANEQAYQLWYRASRAINRAPSPGAFDHASVLAQSALQLDPGFGRAKGVLAYIETQKGYFSFTPDRPAALARGLVLAEEAIALAPEDWYVHEMHGISLMNLRRYEDAVAAFDTALDLHPASEATLVRSALPLLFLGRADEAERRLLTAIRLNPHYRWDAPNFLGMAYFEQERYAEAAARLDEAAGLNPGFIGNMVWRAAAHAQLGNDETARAVAAELMEAAPNWSISKNFVQIKDPAVQSRLDDGLRKAGLPE